MEQKEVISMVGFVYILEKYHLFIQLKKETISLQAPLPKKDLWVHCK